MADVRSAGLAVVVLLVASRPHAAAQEPGTAEPPDRAVTLGVSVGSLLMGNARIDGVGVRAGVPVHRQIDVELGVDWLIRTSTRGRTTDASSLYYFLQASHRVTAPTTERYAVFATYGAGGWVERQPLFLSLPILPHLGIGVQVALGERAALRMDAQGIFGLFGDLRPFTGRISGGIAVPLRRASITRSGVGASND